MMGVYIKDMEMPKSCWECRFELNNMCRATINRMRVESCDRHPDCPLIEVRTPHGDLIDRGEAVKVLCDACGNLACGKDCSFYRKMKNAPTIIESESGNES